MKTIFVQRGPSNVGKTTTIRKLYDTLVGEHPEAPVSDLDPSKTPLLGKKDIRAVIRIDGFLIGFESAGDPGCKDKRLTKSLLAFERLGCDAIVCATRTDGGTVKVVESLEGKGYKIEWRVRTRVLDPSAYAEANHAEAAWMFQEIEAMLPAAAI